MSWAKNMKYPDMIKIIIMVHKNGWEHPTNIPQTSKFSSFQSSVKDLSDIFMNWSASIQQSFCEAKT